MAITDDVKSGTIGASGFGRIEWSPGRQRWSVKQVSPSCPNAGAGAVGTLRKNGIFVCHFVPTGAAIVEPPPLPLTSASDKMQIEWTGATPGATTQVMIIYDDGTG